MRNSPLMLMLGVAVLTGAARRANAHAYPSQPLDLEGKIDRFTLSSGGLLDGFLLDDGTEVHVASYLAKQLGHSVRRGESVRITGLRIPGVRVVIASFILGQSSHETVIDKGASGMDAPAGTTGIPDTSGAGTVTQLLHGLQGQVNGALLDNGLIIRMPPNVPVGRPELFVVGQELAVKGTEIDTEYGRVLRIDSVGATDNELSPVVQPGLEPPLPSP
jgi:hypothetical protein